MRGRQAWTLMLPILIAGELVGHALFHEVIAPGSDARAILLPHTAGGYLDYLYPVLGVCIAFALAAAGGRVVSAFRGGTSHATPSWRFALIPPAAFLAQEQIECFLHDGYTDWLASAEPAVLAGAGLQVPVGLLALWLIRSLLRLAHDVGRTLAALRSSRVRLERAYSGYAHEAAPPRLLALVRGVAERAPPAFA